jgi:GTP cyclohydrolase II
MLIYLKAQEGRGIGLGNKIATYALQDSGFNTYAANEELGFKADQRNYSDAISILKMENFTDIDLFTNNPEKTEALSEAGISVSQVSFPSKPNKYNEKYLHDKKTIGNHKIETI